MSEVKYLHFRAREEGKDGKEQIAAKAGATVAYVEGEEGISFATAWCHPRDRYQKSVGRLKASCRLNSETQSETFPYVGDQTRAAFITAIESEMAAVDYYRVFK